MKTEVIMMRPLFDTEVQQNSKSTFICANDIAMAGNNFRKANGLPQFTLQTWLNTQSTQEFIHELEQNFGKVIETRRGRYGGTWMHPYLAIDLALAISPKLKVEVYKWLYDELLKYRNNSGNSYQRMAGALYERTTSKSTFSKDITKLAIIIKNECGVTNWESATEEQLRLRDKMHENIALLAQVMNNLKEAIRLGIMQAKNLANKENNH